jgi:four helix bundle protein
MRPDDFSANGDWDIWPEAEISSIVREESPAPEVPRHPFDLLERTARFGELVIRFAKRIPHNPVNNRLIDQVVGAGTSVGANYCEADESVSKKDFRNIISRSVKEAKETKYFLRMIAAAEPGLADAARELYREAKELHLIFCAIRRKT